MKNKFKNKLAIITGGSSGLGEELAERLLEMGASLALVARDKKKLDNVKKKLEGLSTGTQKVETFSCDVAGFKDVEKTFSSINKKLGTPDILINSAGILRESYFEKQSLKIFNSVMDINFYGTLHCIKAVLPFFKNSGGGRIVNISSIAGLIGVFGYTAYCSAKHAVTGLTKALRAELKPQNIKIHLVYPPEFDSPMVDDINKYRTPENKIHAQTIPVMTADKVADKIISGIKKEKFEIITGILSNTVIRSDRILPSLSRLVGDLRIKKGYVGPGK